MTVLISKCDFRHKPLKPFSRQLFFIMFIHLPNEYFPLAVVLLALKMVGVCFLV